MWQLYFLICVKIFLTMRISLRYVDQVISCIQGETHQLVIALCPDVERIQFHHPKNVANDSGRG